LEILYGFNAAVTDENGGVLQHCAWLNHNAATDKRVGPERLRALAGGADFIGVKESEKNHLANQ